MPVERVNASQIDLLDTVLDKGIVVDAWACVSPVGIDLTTSQARVVVVSLPPEDFDRHDGPLTVRPHQTSDAASARRP